MQKEAEGRLSVSALDVSDTKAIDQFISSLKDKNIKIDILVNNAGVAAKKDEWSVDLLDWTLKTVSSLFMTEFLWNC
jgi:NADP-dependent 3-hydroxy acid dehydrogenase YdfG